MAKGLLLSLGLILGWVIVQLVVLRVRRPRRVFNAMTLLFLPTLPAFIALYAATPPGLYVLPDDLARTPGSLGALNGLLVHVLLYCTWVEAFYCVDRPVTLRILVEFVKAPAGSLTLAEIRAIYGLDQMITSRLEIMCINGYLEEIDERYVLTGKGRTLAGGIRLVRRALGVPYYFDAPDLRGQSGVRSSSASREQAGDSKA